MEFSLWEQVLLVVLVLASAGVFAQDFSKKLRLILEGKPERKRTDRIAARIARVVKEVLFQSRVVSGRPVAGLLHAFVFLGFLVFALETIDHFFKPFKISIKSTLLGGALPIFDTLVTVAAVLVIIGMVGLAFRRFVLVKISPDPKSYSSGVVALFIVLLMVTYLNGQLRDPVLQKASWWLHALIIIVFPQLILRSKHFHIIMAPVAVFFRTHGLGDYLPLNLDPEQLAAAEEEITLGLETMEVVPWKMRMDFLTCVECKRCTEQCPAWNCEQELDPRGFILAGRAMLEKTGPIIGNVISEAALGQCTSCGACENICPVGIEHLQVLMGAKRAQALSTGVGMVATDFLTKIGTYGNPFSGSKQARKALIEELHIPLYKKGRTEYLLWLGCVWAYNPDARSSLEAMIKVLKESGVSYGVLESEACSGHHSRRQGEEMQFQTLARENITAFEEHDVKKVIAPCPHCLHTLRREYPTLKDGFRVEVTHHSEFLTELIARGDIKLRRTNGKDKVLTFHDPCYLGRYENTYEAPRQVIAQAGFELKELPRKRERSFCCGGGSAGFAREQEVKKRVDQERKREIAESGAKVLITACPECKMMLNAAVEETKDLAELVAESMETSRGKT
ncbi:MAG TPA: heterodisulfide reductase-related iron-sulfur binding cluster [Candidatus Acidoferrales bacterium]|nr:heterodisulfide reductase-related iron-sulfur binding cluster [Candidatus Acidoferrales bacterium]